MPRTRRDGLLTRQRLLDAGCTLFADCGFRDTTVARICELAGTNIAAVNDHFGDKEALYRAALRYAHELASTQYPIDGGLPAEAPPDLRLEAYVDAQLRRTFSGDSVSTFPRLVVMEMAEPTEVVCETLREVLRPHRMHLHGVLHQLLGDDVTADQTWLCVISIISQCYFFAFNRALRERHFGSDRLTKSGLRDIIVHISRFCTAGVRDLRYGFTSGVDPEAPASDSTVPPAGPSNSSLPRRR